MRTEPQTETEEAETVQPTFLQTMVIMEHHHHHHHHHLVVVGRLLLRILRLLMKLLLGRLRIRGLGVRLLLLRRWLVVLLLGWRRMASIVAILLRRRTRIITISVRSRTSTTTAVTLLRQQDSANTLVNRLQGRQVGRRNLDGIACHRQHHNVLPGVELVLVLDHLWTLPIILNTGALQRKLLDLHRDGSTSLRLNNRNIVFRLRSVHVHHPGLSNNTSNNHILRFPVLGRVGSCRFTSIVLDHVFTFGYDNFRVGNIKYQRQRTRSFLDEATGFLWIVHVDTIHLEQYVSQFDTGRTSRRPFHNKRDYGTFSKGIYRGLFRVQKERIRQFLRLEEHDTQGRGKDSSIVILATGRQFAGNHFLAFGTAGRTHLPTVRIGYRRRFCRSCRCGRRKGSPKVIVGRRGRRRTGRYQGLRSFRRRRWSRRLRGLLSFEYRKWIHRSWGRRRGTISVRLARRLPIRRGLSILPRRRLSVRSWWRLLSVRTGLSVRTRLSVGLTIGLPIGRRLCIGV
mmetsp:Transcript_8521/g.16304  ORF Transcript_8521/g.16304 Transcript_8521/m.16304 type:complete len:511 (+) Transcript_8521:50-1582(+)